MNLHQVPAFHPADAIPPIVIAFIYIFATSLLREPSRRNFNAIMIAGAGAAYLSGGFGVWEFVFCAVITYCAYRGLHSYRYIGIGWLLHSCWDVLHHFYGNPIIPFAPTSSAGCGITDVIIAIWFFAQAPSVFELVQLRRASARA
jgi:Family of unknown function (DUF6010)